ncbi:hypothetical protein ZWY2020_029098 [Hordeum vulgare]|nr:hypothetical protein ZWY2020_029098 [Hordeum vulgare]
MPPRPARSGAGRGGGVVKRGRYLTNAASAQTGGHIDLDDDEEGFYCTNFNMLQNSDEEEDDSDEVTFAVLMCFTIAKYHMVSFCNRVAMHDSVALIMLNGMNQG